MKIMMSKEKMGRISFMVLLMLVLFLVEANLGYGYTIDGNLTDWGINLSAATDKGYLNTNLPSGGLDIDYTTEDNTDNSTQWFKVLPGWSYYNFFDAEAIYFDNDQYNAYIAVVQGLPIGGGTAPNNPWFLPGDIGIDINNDGVYEYGIDIDDGKLYNVTSWKNVYYTQYNISNPWQINTGTSLGTISFTYSGNQNNHYVLEAAIQLSLLGLSADSVSPLTIHWTQQCGNDYLTLNADVNPVPEPSTLLLLGCGLISAGVYRWRRMRK
jgi:hypothetical protein